MGRHAIVSSPLRSPAVLVGVPVATVLATFGTTAVLGGVVPSAAEAPLRAEAPDAVVTGTVPVALAPVGAPAVLLGAPVPEADVAATQARAVPSAQAARLPERPAAGAPTVTGPHLVRVPSASAAPVRHEGPRAVEIDPPVDVDVTPVARPAARAVDDAALPTASRSVSAASPVETVAAPASPEAPQRGDGDDDGGSLVDVGSPSSGLSVLSFG